MSDEDEDSEFAKLPTVVKRKVRDLATTKEIQEHFVTIVNVMLFDFKRERAVQTELRAILRDKRQAFREIRALNRGLKDLTRHFVGGEKESAVLHSVSDGEVEKEPTMRRTSRSNPPPVLRAGAASGSLQCIPATDRGVVRPQYHWDLDSFSAEDREALLELSNRVSVLSKSFLGEPRNTAPWNPRKASTRKTDEAAAAAAAVAADGPPAGTQYVNVEKFLVDVMAHPLYGRVYKHAISVRKSKDTAGISLDESVMLDESVDKLRRAKELQACGGGSGDNRASIQSFIASAAFDDRSNLLDVLDEEAYYDEAERKKERKNDENGKAGGKKKDEKKEVPKEPKKEKQDKNINPSDLPPDARQVYDKSEKTNPMNHFKHITKIGKGGFGDVLSAKCPRTGQTIALKKIRSRFEGRHARLAANEIICLDECRHENIINLLETFFNKNKIWYTMDFCDGGSLRQVITEADLNSNQISYIMVRIVRGLHHLHKNGFIHRDVKSDNVLFSLSGDVKLCDMGLVIKEQERPCSMVGSRYWMAPEVIRREQYDYKIDVWSLGALLFELLTGNPPYHSSGSVKALLHLVIYGAPYLKWGSKHSEDLRDFTKCLLHSDPKQRYSTDQLLEHKFLQQDADLSSMKKVLESVFMGTSLRLNGF